MPKRPSRCRPRRSCLIDFVSAAKVYVLPGVVSIVGLLFVGRTYYGTPKGQLGYRSIVVARARPWGDFHQASHGSTRAHLGNNFCRRHASCRCIVITKSAISNRYIAAGLGEAVDEIREGTTLAAALDRPKVFPKLAIEMLSVGEETGSLEGMLHDVAEFYEGDLDLRLTQLTTWIEPVLLLFMGVLVGGIVIVMYLPVFQMAGQCSNLYLRFDTGQWLRRTEGSTWHLEA